MQKSVSLQLGLVYRVEIWCAGFIHRRSTTNSSHSCQIATDLGLFVCAHKTTAQTRLSSPSSIMFPQTTISPLALDRHHFEEEDVPLKTYPLNASGFSRVDVLSGRGGLANTHEVRYSHCDMMDPAYTHNIFCSPKCNPFLLPTGQPCLSSSRGIEQKSLPWPDNQARQGRVGRIHCACHSKARWTLSQTQPSNGSLG